MQNQTAMKIFQSFSNLIDNEFDMDFFENAFAYHIVEISLHELK